MSRIGRQKRGVERRRWKTELEEEGDKPSDIGLNISQGGTLLDYMTCLTYLTIEEVPPNKAYSLLPAAVWLADDDFAEEEVEVSDISLSCPQPKRRRSPSPPPADP